MGEWPLVDANDDGIRPAGRPDECLYCQQRVGSPHGADCVVVTKRVEMLVKLDLGGGRIATARWQFDEPHSWDVNISEFHKNEGSWCASNFLSSEDGSVRWDEGADPWAELEALAETEGCLCGVLEFERSRIVDDTPRRKVRAAIEAGKGDA